MFPDDPLSKLADEVLNSPALPSDIATTIALDLINDPQGKPGSTVEEVLSLLRQFGDVKLSSDVGIPDLATLQSELDHVWDQKKTAFLGASDSIRFGPLKTEDKI